MEKEKIEIWSRGKNRDLYGNPYYAWGSTNSVSKSRGFQDIRRYKPANFDGKDLSYNDTLKNIFDDTFGTDVVGETRWASGFIKGMPSLTCSQNNSFIVWLHKKDDYSECEILEWKEALMERLFGFMPEEDSDSVMVICDRQNELYIRCVKVTDCGFLISFFHSYEE